MSELSALDRDRRRFTCGDIIALYRFDGTWSAGLVTDLRPYDSPQHSTSGYLRMRLFLEEKAHTTPCSFTGRNDFIELLGRAPTSGHFSWVAQLYPELAAVLGAADLPELQKLLAEAGATHGAC